MSSIRRDFGHIAVAGSAPLIIAGMLLVFLPSLNVFGIDSQLAGVVAMNVGLATLSLGLFVLTRHSGTDEPGDGESRRG